MRRPSGGAHGAARLPDGACRQAGPLLGVEVPGAARRANVFFDTCVYHQPGIDLLRNVIPAENILFASEMLGAVRGADPETGIAWDDTKTYIDAAALTEQQRALIFERNVRRVYPRLDAQLTRAGR